MIFSNPSHGRSVSYGWNGLHAILRHASRRTVSSDGWDTTFALSSTLAGMLASCRPSSPDDVRSGQHPS